MAKETISPFWNGKINSAQDFIALGNKYFAHLQLLNRSEQTIYAQQIHLKKFVEWCKERQINTPAEMTKQIISQYQSYLARKINPNTKRPLTAGHRQNVFSIITGFYKWLHKKRHILYNPTDAVEPIKQPKHLPHNTLTVQEIEKVMQQPNLATRKGSRDRAILELAYSTAMRRSELAKLDLDDLNFERMTVLVRDGKGQKDRTLPLGRRAYYWLNRYLQYTRPLLQTNPQQKALFLNKCGERLHRHAVSESISKYIKAAQIGKTGSCHTLRHSVATLMMEQGCDLRFIQELLGHTRLSTTQVYTKVTIARLKETHDKTHPARTNPTKTKEILTEITSD